MSVFFSHFFYGYVLFNKFCEKEKPSVTQMLTINLNCYADSIRSSERLYSYASEFYATLHLLCALSDIQ